MRLFPLGLAALSISALSAQNPTPGLDLTAIDKQEQPCVNFYRYACGAWLKNNSIPPDQSSWGRFSELAERNRAILREILEKAAGEKKRNAIDQKIGDYYASCMDEAAIGKKGIAALKPELDRIDALETRGKIAEEVGRLHAHGVNVLFNFSSGQDFRDSTEVIAQADQGGLGLPDRDYYLKEDPKMAETRQKYVAHVQKMFELMGSAPAKAAANAQTVMLIETALAKGSLDLVSRRDPEKVYHRMTRMELNSLDRAFSWPLYFEAVGSPPIQNLNVAVPDFFKAMNQLLETQKIEDWKTYFTWQLVHAEAPLLPQPFVQENFEFFGKTLTGAKELKPRWKRCVAFADNELGEAVGQAYVQQVFGKEGKDRTLKMVREIEAAMNRDLQQIDWMTPETKQKAFEKLRAITNKIGYPDKWRDYSSVRIVRGDALGNSERATEFEFKRQLDKIGKPVDRLEWQMTPPTVNAYYDPQMNNINFPAGILQPPFFDKSGDDAVNYGAIGAVVGHELTHGFDDEGRQFDAAGNLKNWWTEQDAKAYEQRSQCIVDEYSDFTAIDNVKLNGKLTLGENTADNGGLRLAYMALMSDLAGKPAGNKDGLTPAQRFFLGWGQIWCENETDEVKRLLAQTNPHSLPEFRVNGVVSNMPEFANTFSCKVNQPMVREKSCKVW